MRKCFACLALLPLALGCVTSSTFGPSGDQPQTGPATNADGKTLEQAFISTSGGEPGGLVVFWPRVIPRSDDPELSALAGEVQAKLVELARATYPDRPIDVRPEPERVCPREGCPAATFGIVILHDNESHCAAVALTSAGETSTNALAVWAGDLVLKEERVEFREYPESYVGIRDYVPCAELLEAMAGSDEDIVAALRAASE
jgi:hypothetical protein